MKSAGVNRVFANTLATYGRSLVSIGLGLFSSRWILAALGESDLGLWSVLSSVMLCITLLNIVMGTAVARFYAHSIGEVSQDGAGAGAGVRAWFNVACAVHFILPPFLVVAGYPLGVWLIKSWLVIPVHRVDACLWVFWLSLMSALVTMMSVPYVSMFRAKQNIVEMSCWEMMCTLMNFAGAAYLLGCRQDRLIAYAVIISAAPAFVSIVQILRARKRYSECRIVMREMFQWARIRQLICFGFWDLFSSLGCIFRDQGAIFVINKNFGPVTNAAYGIANQLSNHCNNLANALMSAMSPAITTAAGAGSRGLVQSMALRSCKLGTVLVMLFAIPLSLEVDEVLRLWLVHPPAMSAQLCCCVLCTICMFKLGWGFHMAIEACGKVAVYQMTVGSISILTLPMIILVAVSFGALAVGYVLIVNGMILSTVRVLFAQAIAGIRVRDWIVIVVLPIAVVAICSLAVGYLVVMSMEAGLIRICCTTVVCVLTFLSLSWMIALDRVEKDFVIDFLCRLTRRRARD